MLGKRESNCSSLVSDESEPREAVSATQKRPKYAEEKEEIKLEFQSDPDDGANSHEVSPSQDLL